jgi:DNA-binding NarL/FixJ family response regulator
MIRVSIVEDDLPTREACIKLLRHSPDIVCIATYANAKEAEEGIPTLVPDVVLMDINMPGRSGIQCVETLKRAFPNLQILMLTTYDEGDMIFDSLRAGASGYLLKRNSVLELPGAIKEIHGGGSPMSLQIARKVVSHFHRIQKPASDVDTLTKRETEILALLTKGLPYKQIADQLDISPSTVHGHLHAIYGKLHVQSRTEAVVKYLQR